MYGDSYRGAILSIPKMVKNGRRVHIYACVCSDVLCVCTVCVIWVLFMYVLVCVYVCVCMCVWSQILTVVEVVVALGVSSEVVSVLHTQVRHHLVNKALHLMGW